MKVYLINILVDHNTNSFMLFGRVTLTQFILVYSYFIYVPFCRRAQTNPPCHFGLIASIFLAPDNADLELEVPEPSEKIKGILKNKKGKEPKQNKSVNFDTEDDASVEAVMKSDSENESNNEEGKSESESDDCGSRQRK